MADDVQFSLTGLDALLGKLDSVKQDVKRKGGRTALRKAAALVAEQAKSNARGVDDAETGRSIADNIGLSWNGRLFRQNGDLGFRVGVRQGAVIKTGGDTSSGAPTPHWRLLEFGTEKMRARPFMRRALADSINEATQTFITEYEKALDRAIKRAAKAAGGQ